MEFDVLAQKLAYIDPENDEYAEEKLKEIVDDYNELCNVVKKINEIFSLTLLANVFMSQGSLCTCVFFLFTRIDLYLMIKFIFTLPSAVIQLFFTCYYGQLLQNSSLRIADEAYNCNWHGKNLKFRKMILLTMLKVQKPQTMTGWKFMEIGLPVLYWVLQTVRSYYSFLSGLYKI
ncbi:hypothetical protein PVAND_000274 [Polypedilum vanderplanki]|uniref:Odorant receptor n=1 Tax=Polypedilum vanderplanki TaxID=319348 RepID=A0A9J6BJU0_POLVA|nr:hypothetical protein PVAND_000274 [Polypedilum vanderplanki]